MSKPEYGRSSPSANLKRLFVSSYLPPSKPAIQKGQTPKRTRGRKKPLPKSTPKSPSSQVSWKWTRVSQNRNCIPQDMSANASAPPIHAVALNKTIAKPEQCIASSHTIWNENEMKGEIPAHCPPLFVHAVSSQIEKPATSECNPLYKKIERNIEKKAPNYKVWWRTENIQAAHMCFFDRSKRIEIASKSIAKARYVQRNMKICRESLPQNTRPTSLCHPIWRQKRSCKSANATPPWTNMQNQRKGRKIEAAAYRRNAARDHDDGASVWINVESDFRLLWKRVKDTTRT